MSQYFEEEEFSSHLNLKVWTKVFRFGRSFKGIMGLLALFMVFVASVDIIMPLMTRHAIDEIITPGRWEALAGFAVLYAAIALFQAINVTVFILLAGKVETGVSYAIRQAGFDRLQQLSFSYFDRTPVGWLMARMTTDTTKLAEIIAWGLVDVVWGTTLMSGIAIVMLIMNARLALVVLAVVPFLAWISKKFQVIILRSYREVRKTNSRITASFNEGIMGAITSKTLVREDQNTQEFRLLSDSMFNASFRAAVQSALYLPLVQIGSMVGTGLAVWNGGSGVIAGDVTYGTLVMFLSYAGFFFIPIQEVARIFAELQNAQASAERVISLIETTPEIEDKSANGQPPAQSLQGAVRFADVTFTYKKGQRVLKNFNLDVKQGEALALVGETGGGKSTIVNLVCRFYEPTTGQILIDGREYSEYPLRWLQSNFGVVLQSPHLFSGSIRDNIRYGRLDATDEEVQRAAEIVHAHRFIEQLDEGYETAVLEGGSNLSTGQKQLLSLARALLANPPILIMDEATSAVDTETEQLIQAAIEQVVSRRTSFIIAHRLSTIRNADRILVIHQGKIIESGSHQDLLTARGHYHELYTTQFKHEMTQEILDAPTG